MGTTPLILAAHLGRKRIVQELLNCGADVNAYTVIGTTALHSAAEQVRLLLQLVLSKQTVC